MKTLTLLPLVLISLLSSTSFAATGNQEVSKQVEILRSIALNTNELQLEGETPFELIRSLRDQLIGDESIKITLNSVPDALDESQIGTTNSDAAMSLVESAMDEMEYYNTSFSDEDRKTVAQVFKKLEETPAIFAWNPFGSSSCSSVYSTVVIIDTESKMAYEFVFLNGEGC